VGFWKTGVVRAILIGVQKNLPPFFFFYIFCPTGIKFSKGDVYKNFNLLNDSEFCEKSSMSQPYITYRHKIICTGISPHLFPDSVKFSVKDLRIMMFSIHARHANWHREHLTFLMGITEITLACAP
jgi:hypothetical protein